MNDTSSHCWLDIAPGSPFPLHHLPFGVAMRPDGTIGAFVAIGDLALDLADAVGTGLLEDTPAEYGLLDAGRVLNGFAAAGRTAHRALRDRLTEIFTDASVEGWVRPCLVPIDELTMRLPVAVGDFVDFYSSLHHATNLGRMFRPDGDPLVPHWRQLPIGYHGRSGTIVPDGTDIVRPAGLRRAGEGAPTFGPSEQLDIELEVGCIVGAPAAGVVAAADAEDHLFGLCLVNDWSARDIQAYEYQPLGPFLGKSFATSMSPWITTLDALAPFRVAPPVQDPAPAAHLRTTGPTGFDLHLEVTLRSTRMAEAGIEPVVVSRTGFADMYWTPAQQIAHMTSNGAGLRAGDLFASGTVSGPTPGSEGSFIELTRDRPIELPDGTRRTFLHDGDRVTLRGWAGSDPATRIGLGSVEGVVR